MPKFLDAFETFFNNPGLLLNLRDRSASKLLPLSLDPATFMRKLRKLDSKKAQEEVVQSYLSSFKKRLSEADVPNVEIEDMIKICMTCEILGYPASFMYVHCVKLAQKGNLREKHTGYSGASFFLNPEHELVILLINTLQKDLKSSNYMEVLFALSVICDLINADTVQNVFHLVQEKLNHEKSCVRKCAILTYYHCLELISSQSAHQMAVPKLEKALGDPELEVVSAAVCTIFKIIQKIPGDFSYLIKSLVELQEQILLRRIPRSMVYCDIPAPWLQQDIMRLLRLLCRQPEQFDLLTAVLKKTLQQVNLQSTIAYAITFEVIETVTCIKPDSELLEMVLTTTSSFLRSKNWNIKLAGIEILILVVQRLKSSIGVPQQEVIVACLKLSDESIHHKALDLLYNLANASNVKAICKKMMEFLSTSSDKEKKRKLSLKILQLANKFVDKKEWFVSTVLKLLKESGDLLSENDVSSLIEQIYKDPILKGICKKSCMKLCKSGDISSSLVKLTSCTLSTTAEFEQALPQLLTISDDNARSWVFTFLLEILITTKTSTPGLVAILKSAISTESRQSNEILQQTLNLIECLSDLKCDIDKIETMDPSLSFLDDFVIQDLKSSGICYQPHSIRMSSESLVQGQSEIKLADSDVEVNLPPMDESSTYSPSLKSPTYSLISSHFSTPSTSYHNFGSSSVSSISAMPNVKSVWTKEGRKESNKEDDSIIEVEDKDEDFKDLFAGIS